MSEGPNALFLSRYCQFPSLTLKSVLISFVVEFPGDIFYVLRKCFLKTFNLFLLLLSVIYLDLTPLYVPNLRVLRGIIRLLISHQLNKRFSGLFTCSFFFYHSQETAHNLSVFLTERSVKNYIPSGLLSFRFNI
jgi:hypothetical protein